MKNVKKQVQLSVRFEVDPKLKGPEIVEAVRMAVNNYNDTVNSFMEEDTLTVRVLEVTTHVTYQA